MIEASLTKRSIWKTSLSCHMDMVPSVCFSLSCPENSGFHTISLRDMSPLYDIIITSGPEKVNIDIINDLKKIILTSENKLREIMVFKHREISLLNNQKVKCKVYKYIFSFFENYQYTIYNNTNNFLDIWEFFPPVSQIGKHRIDGWKHAINETNKDRHIRISILISHMIIQSGSTFTLLLINCTLD